MWNLPKKLNLEEVIEAENSKMAQINAKFDEKKLHARKKPNARNSNRNHAHMRPTNSRIWLDRTAAYLPFTPPITAGTFQRYVY